MFGLIYGKLGDRVLGDTGPVLIWKKYIQGFGLKLFGDNGKFKNIFMEIGQAFDFFKENCQVKTMPE